MKKALLPIFALAAVLSLASCQKEKETSTSNQPTETQTQTQIETETQTQIETSTTIETTVVDEGFAIEFSALQNVQVKVYTTSDFAETTEVYVSRDSKTGLPISDGSGQINFELVFDEGYCLADSIEITGTYKNLKSHGTDPADLQENQYRITKIESPLTINITTKLDDHTPAVGYNIEFAAHENAKVYLFETQDYSVDPVEGYQAQSRDQSGAFVQNGDGQVNFKVVCDAGYKVANIEITPKDNYKNLKGPDDTEAEGVYRITKIKGDITINITTELEVK